MSMIHSANSVEVEVDEIIDAICWLLARWGVKSDKVPSPKRHEIGYRVGVGKNNGLLRLFLMTKDNLFLDFEVDLREVVKHGRAAIEGIVHTVRTNIDDARRQRQEKQRTHLDAAIGVALGAEAPAAVAQAKALDRATQREADQKAIHDVATSMKPHPIRAAVVSLTRNPGKDNFVVPGPETKQ